MLRQARRRQSQVGACRHELPHERRRVGEADRGGITIPPGLTGTITTCLIYTCLMQVSHIPDAPQQTCLTHVLQNGTYTVQYSRTHFT